MIGVAYLPASSRGTGWADDSNPGKGRSWGVARVWFFSLWSFDCQRQSLAANRFASAPRKESGPDPTQPCRFVVRQLAASFATTRQNWSANCSSHSGGHLVIRTPVCGCISGVPSTMKARFSTYWFSAGATLGQRWARCASFSSGTWNRAWPRRWRRGGSHLYWPKSWWGPGGTGL